MARKFILKSSGAELVLPVTPQSFTVSRNNNIQKISIHQLGDVNLWGQPGLCDINITSFFPSSERSYAFNGGYTGNPYGAVELINGWIRDKEVVRFIVSDTPINISVMPASLEYGEDGGTGDVEYTLILKEYRSMEAVEVSSTGASRETENEPVTKEQSYQVKSGDTLWAIAQKYYGDGSLAWNLAEVNGIKNANLIYPGDNLTIPEKSVVQATAYTGVKNTAPAPTVKTNTETGKTEVSWPKVGGGGGTNYMMEK